MLLFGEYRVQWFNIYTAEPCTLSTFTNKGDR
jgi:hypothetical protein